MGKYLKKIESTAIIGPNSKEASQLSKVNHYKDQPLCGPSVLFFKNPDTNNYCITFKKPKERDIHDTITNFEWFVEYTNDIPHIMIKFNDINPLYREYPNAVICIECNYKIKEASQKQYRANKALAVYDGDECLVPDNEGISYHRLNKITVGTFYQIDILKPLNNNGPWQLVQCLFGSNIPKNWVMTFNIRPNIRIAGQKIFLKYLQDYKEIKSKYYN